MGADGTHAMMPVMGYPDWPLVDLRLRTSDLVLRPMREADLPTVADRLPPDLELDPTAVRYPGLAAAAERRVMAHQSYWRALGGWSPAKWELPFVVLRDDEFVGVQALEGQDFPTLRTVDSFSWLVAPERGHGLGRQMRRAVLALAFGPLNARAAITSAWHDNHASLGVSRAVGYHPNGESLHRRDGGVDVMVHLRLGRTEWADGDDVQIAGFEPCRPWFGV
jgi:RimJ/RimL family protein N-acetyltransferase